MTRPRLVLAAAITALVAAGGLALALALPHAGEGTAVGGWHALAPAPKARTEVTAARIGDLAYVVGGYAVQGGACVPTGTLQRYSLRHDSWSLGPALPGARHHAAAVARRGKLYVVGGYAGQNFASQTGTLLRLDPVKGSWKQLRPMPTARGALAAAVIGGRLYAIGGAASGKPLRRLEIYDFKRNRWKRGPSMPTAREHLGAAALDGKLYVVGGRVPGDFELRAVERFNPRTPGWTTLPQLHTGRSGIATLSSRGRIVVFGGERPSGTIPEVEAYDPTARRWSPLPDMLTPRHGLGAVGQGARVYSLLGGPQPGCHASTANQALDLR